jgi:hypothetical protein
LPLDVIVATTTFFPEREARMDSACEQEFQHPHKVSFKKKKFVVEEKFDLVTV